MFIGDLHVYLNVDELSVDVVLLVRFYLSSCVVEFALLVIWFGRELIDVP